ncbi:hypothetical protein GJ496_004443 [Pomphorhynchus laevis]|nr:hypothetical protein GJ496_005388 [Pomphorhynchus laevis]KAI0981300.1 hypothetical protein GJ496_004443 [Pomphorhynchus laevis]
MTILMKSSWKFKDQYDIDSRKRQFEDIISIHDNRVAVLVEPLRESSTLPMIDKRKYLVPVHITVGQFQSIIQKRLNLSPTTAIFIFVNDTIPSQSLTMNELYQMYADEDGFLYIAYGEENVYG